MPRGPKRWFLTTREILSQLPIGSHIPFRLSDGPSQRWAASKASDCRRVLRAHLDTAQRKAMNKAIFPRAFLTRDMRKTLKKKAAPLSLRCCQPGVASLGGEVRAHSHVPSLRWFLDCERGLAAHEETRPPWI